MQVKRLYDDGLVDDNKKKLGLTQWKILLQVKKDMSQEKPITLRQQHNKKRRRRDTNSHQFMNYIDFYMKKKQLHREICEAIRDLMTAYDVKEVDLLGSNADHAFFSIEPDGSDSLQEIEVNRVYLDKDNEVLVDSPDLYLADKDFYLQHNHNVVPCSIDTIYESVYQVLEQGK